MISEVSLVLLPCYHLCIPSLKKHICEKGGDARAHAWSRDTPPQAVEEKVGSEVGSDCSGHLVEAFGMNSYLWHTDNGAGWSLPSVGRATRAGECTVKQAGIRHGAM